MFWIHIASNQQELIEALPNMPKLRSELKRKVGDMFVRTACSGYSLIREQGQRIIIGDLHIPPDRIKINWADLELSSTKLMPLLGDDIASLVIYDRESNTVTAVRSIASTHAVFYKLVSGSCYVTSSMSLMRSISGDFELNDKVLPEFYAYRTITHPDTLARDVYKLGSGEFLKIDLTNENICEQRSHPLSQTELTADITVSLAAQKTEEMLSKSISRMIEEDRPPTILLSGGLDSSVLAAITKTINPDVNSLSSGFSFANRNEKESEYATSMATVLDINHSTFMPSGDDYLRGLIDAIAISGEPVHHLQSVLLHLLFEDCAKKGITNIICGEGADGFFGTNLHGRLHRFRSIVNMLARTGRHPLVQATSSAIAKVDSRFEFFTHSFGANTSVPDHIVWTPGFFGDYKLITSILGCEQEDILRSRYKVMEQFVDCDLMDKVSLAGFYWDVSTTLTIWAQLASNSAAELLYPFMLPNLIRYISSIPWDIKAIELKSVIKEILRNHKVPAQYISRPKLSFGFPTKYWALPNTLFQPLVDMASEEMDSNTLKKLQRTDMTKAMLLWNMLNHFLWKKIHVDGINPADLQEEVISRTHHKKTSAGWTANANEKKNNRRHKPHSLYAATLRKLFLPAILWRESRESAIKHWKNFQSSQYWPKQKMLDYQFSKLQTLLNHAFTNSPYYRELFQQRGLTPASIKSFEDLQLLPVLTKSILNDHMDKILSENYDRDQLQQFSTGGTTTGLQIMMYRDGESFNIKQGLAWRHEGWVGRRPCEKMALFWPASADFQPPLSFKQNVKGKFFLREVLYRTGSAHEEVMSKTYEDLIRFKPRIVKVFPSALFGFCEFVEYAKLPLPRIEGVMSTGEVLYEHQRRKIEDIFGCSVFDMYGSREVGNTSCECDQRSGLHMAMETQIVEFTEDGKAVDYGQEGDLLITDLTNLAMPMIRYKIDDRGALLDTNCPCGRTLQLMSPAIGRLSDDFWSPDGTRHSGLVLAVHIVTANQGIGQLQIIQKTLTDFHVRITDRPAPTEEVFEFIRKQMKTIIGDSINIQIEVVSNLPQERSGKTRFLICEIDPPDRNR